MGGKGAKYMSAEIPTIEPYRLALEVSDEFLNLTKDIVDEVRHGGRRFLPADFIELDDAAIANGLSEEAQAHVLEAAMYGGTRQPSKDIRSRIAETVGVMKILRDYYKPTEEGLRVVMDPSNIHRVEVVRTPTVALSLVKDGGAPQYRLQVEAKRLAYMGTSKDNIDYPAAGTGIVNFWNYRDVFPKKGESVAKRLAPVAVLGSADNPRPDTIQGMAKQHGQAATNLLLAKAGVPVEKLPAIPEDEITQRRQLLVRSFAERLVALEAGTADQNHEPMSLKDAHFMLSVLKQGDAKAPTFVEEVRGYIIGEYRRVHQQLMKGTATLDQDFTLGKEQALLNTVLTTHFGRNGRFAALFAE